MQKSSEISDRMLLAPKAYLATKENIEKFKNEKHIYFTEDKRYFIILSEEQFLTHLQLEQFFEYEGEFWNSMSIETYHYRQMLEEAGIYLRQRDIKEITISTTQNQEFLKLEEKFDYNHNHILVATYINFENGQETFLLFKVYGKDDEMVYGGAYQKGVEENE